MSQPGGGDSRTANVTLTADTSQYQQGMQQSAQQTNLLGQSIDKLSSKLDGITKRAGKKLLQFSAGDFSALAGATAAAATFESQLSSLRATAAVTGKDINGFKASIESAFQSFPVSRQSVVQLTEAITNMGYTAVPQVKQLTETFIKLGAASGENTLELANGLTQLSRMMGNTSPAQINGFANALLTTSKNAGVSSTAVLNFSQAIAPMARQAGIGEAKVLGISTAFSKAGADGYVAANTFSSMISDMTNLIQTGSPEIAKYATLIGVTDKQFKKMDKTNALVSIFEALDKQGPRAIQTLNRLGYDGIRAQAAISAVAQSGGLRANIADALGSATNSKNLDKGAKAAFSGFSDSLVSMRNAFTQLGTTIGTTFLKPLELVMKPLNGLLTIMNALIKPFAPLIAGVGALAAGITALGGAALLTMGIVSKGALAATLFRGGGNLRRALGGGYAVGQNPAVTNTASEAFRQGNMGIFSRQAYRVGAGVGNVVGQSVVGRVGPDLVREAVGRGAAIPISAIRWGAQEQTRFLRSSLQRGFVRETGMTPLAPVWKAGSPSDELKKLGFTGVKMVGASAATGAQLAGRITMAGLKTLFNPLMIAMVGIPLALKGISMINDKTKKAEDYTDALNPITKYNQALGIANKNLAEFSTGLNQATISLADKQAPVTWKNAGILTSRDINNPQKLTDDNLKDLHRHAPKDAKALRELLQTYNISDPRQVHMFAQQASAAGYDKPVIEKALKNITQGDTAGGGKPPNVDHLLDIAFGSEGQGNFARNPSDTGKKIYGTIASGIGTAYKVDELKHSEKYAATAKVGRTLDLFTGMASKIKPDTEVGQAKIQIAALAGLMSKTLGGAGKDEFQKYLTEQFIAARSQWETPAKSVGGRGVPGQPGVSVGGGQWTPPAGAGVPGGGPVAPPADPKDIRRVMVQAIKQTQQGRSFINQIPKSAQESPEQFDQLLSGYLTKDKSAYEKNISSAGPLGAAILKDPTIMNIASGGKDQYSDPKKRLAAEDALAAKALQLGAAFTQGHQTAEGAAQALAKVRDTAANGVDPALEAMAAHLKAVATADYEATVLPTKSRQGQTEYFNRKFANARQERIDHPGKASEEDFQEAKTQKQQMERSNYEFVKQMYITIRDYNKQMDRSYEDYYTSVERQQEDFALQMTRQDRDFHKQIYRQTRDFNIQMAHGLRDYNKQRYRMQRDFDISMKQQAEQASQTIYSPYQRIYAKQTADAGTLIANLKDQNQVITQQFKQLNQLKNMGVGQSAIDALDLANPENAQQLNALVNDMMDNPQLVKAINSAVGVRQKATTTLTQSSFNMTFRNTVDGFHRSFSDMAKDFKTSRDDAYEAENKGLKDMKDDFAQARQDELDDESKGLNRMAADFTKMVRRAKTDLKDSMTEIYGDLKGLTDKTFEEMGRYLAKQLPAWAKEIQDTLNSLKPPDFLNGNNDTGGGGSSAPYGSAQNPNTTPGVLGVNPSGQTGEYNSAGKFIPVSVSKLPDGQSLSTLPHIAKRGSANTPAGAQAYARSMLSAYGWGQDQMPALIELWNRESGWRWDAYNNNGGATGIPQALPGSKMASAGADWRTNGATQIRWGLGYIKERYKSPIGALQQWDEHDAVGAGWYDTGGVLPPGTTRAINATGKPEYILTPKQLAALHTSGMGTPATNIYKIYTDNSMTFKDITVVSQDPNEMAKKLAQKAKIAKLSKSPRSTAA